MTRGKHDRLKELQDELDILMDEVHRLRDNIRDEGRRKSYPFPFERSKVDEKTPAPDAVNSK